MQPSKHVAALALAAIPATALISGLVAFASSHQSLMPWFYAAGTIPVLAVLLVTVAQDLLHGEFGLDIIAAFSMLGRSLLYVQSHCVA